METAKQTKEKMMETYLLQSLTTVSSLQVLWALWQGTLKSQWFLGPVLNCSIELIKTKKEFNDALEPEWLRNCLSHPLLSLQLLLSVVMLKNSILFDAEITIDVLTAAVLVAVQMCVRI